MSHDDSKHIIILFSGQSPDQLISFPPHFPIYSIPHPKGENNTTLCIYWNHIYYELQSKLLHKYASWFIGQRVSSSNHIYLASKMDIRFLLLPYFEKAGENQKYSPLDQIITQPMKNDISRIPLESIQTSKLSSICDINDKYGEDMIFYRYNPEKTLTWLMKKVQKLIHTIVVQNQKKLQRLQPTFVQSFNINRDENHPTVSGDEGKETEEDVKLALELVCDQLSDNLATQLITKFGMKSSDIGNKPTTTLSNKRKADWEIALEQELDAAKYNNTSKPSSTNISNTNNVETKKPSTVTAAATTTTTTPNTTTTTTTSKPVDTSATTTNSFSYNGNSVAKTDTKPASSSVKKTVKANESAAKGSKSMLNFFTKK